MRVTVYICDGCSKDIEADVPRHGSMLQDNAGVTHHYDYCSVACAALHMADLVAKAEGVKP